MAHAGSEAQITGEYDGYASSASEGSTYLPSRRPRKRLAGLATEVSPRGDPALSKSAVGEKAGADEPPFTSRLAVSDWARRTAQATGVFREIEAEEGGDVGILNVAPSVVMRSQGAFKVGDVFSGLAPPGADTESVDSIEELDEPYTPAVTPSPQPPPARPLGMTGGRLGLVHPLPAKPPVATAGGSPHSVAPLPVVLPAAIVGRHPRLAGGPLPASSIEGVRPGLRVGAGVQGVAKRSVKQVMERLRCQEQNGGLKMHVLKKRSENMKTFIRAARALPLGVMTSTAWTGSLRVPKGALLNGRGPMQYHDWNGRTVFGILDLDRRLSVGGVGSPQDPEWEGEVIGGVHDIMAALGPKVAIPSKSTNDRRGSLGAVNIGLSFGGGQQRPGNLYVTKANQLLLREAMASQPFLRLTGHVDSER
ncbi:hypothetical protein EV715DRAFT_298311 [Schizophyllum commune]